MSETILTKRCPHCKQVKPIAQFFKNKSKKNGFSCWCKLCLTKKGKSGRKRYEQSAKGKIAKQKYQQNKKGRAACKRYNQSAKGQAAQKRYRQSDKSKITKQRFELNNKLQIKAKTAVNNAIKLGRLPHANTLPCHYCPNQAKEYHHWHGYEQQYWLDVIPVCKSCHVKERKKAS